MKAPAVVIAILLLVAPSAVASTGSTPAWRGLVLVLSPQVEDDLTRNAMVRIVGEFGAALFQVAMRPIDPGVDLMVQLEKSGSDLYPIAPLAAFAIVRDPGDASGTVAVWVSNRMTRTTTVQRVQIRAENVERAAAQLAVETVDLVRVSVAGLWPILSSSRKAGTGDNPPTGGPGAGASTGGARVRLGMGVAIFQTFDTVPSSWVPQLAVTYGRPDHIELRADLAGLGSGSEVIAGGGLGARLQRAVLAVGVLRFFRAERMVQPLLSAAIGVHRLGVEGTGAPDARGHDRAAFSALVSAGGGLALMLGSHVALTAEADALFLLPSVVVRVGDVDAARLDRTSILGHAGLLATF